MLYTFDLGQPLEPRTISGPTEVGGISQGGDVVALVNRMTSEGQMSELGIVVVVRGRFPCYALASARPSP